jgi:hypothetical protein
MSIFQSSYEENKAIGEFRIPEFDTYFEYRISEGKAPGQGTWGLENGFLHEIAVCDGSIRFANVKKTVAYVAVDEDDEGKPVVEKWAIKHTWKK